MLTLALASLFVACVASDEPCDGETCAPGQICSSGACWTVCSVETDCAASESCIDGLCTAGAGECQSSIDCEDPGLCEDINKAECVGGECTYGSIDCTDPPSSECSDDDAILRTFASIGTCNPATGACEYPATDSNCAQCSANCLGLCDNITCDDNTDCQTNGTCVPLPPRCQYQLMDDDTPCEDDDPCTATGACSSGDCSDTVAMDDGEPCNGEEGYCYNGSCVECGVPAECDDKNSCTDDACESDGTCSNTNRTGSCDDRDPCTTNDTCDGSSCAGTPIADGSPCDGEAGLCYGGVCGECITDTDCDDDNDCTDDECTTSRTCQFVNDDTNTCDDGKFCNGADACSGGECIPGEEDPCPGPDGDNNCSESCDEANDNCTGNDDEGSACNDGLYCNGADYCSDVGACNVHAGDPCPGPDGDNNCSESCNETNDNCSAHDDEGSACNDGLYCNGADYCSDVGACNVHAGDPCPGPDGDSDCRESCNEANDDCSAVDSGACNDGNWCTENDQCDASGTCTGSLRGWTDTVSFTHSQDESSGWGAIQTESWTVPSNTPITGVRIRGKSNEGGYCYAYWGTGHVVKHCHTINAGQTGNNIWYNHTDGDTALADDDTYNEECEEDPESGEMICTNYCPAATYFNHTGTARICQHTNSDCWFDLPAGPGDATGLTDMENQTIHVIGRHTMGSGTDAIQCNLEVNCQ